MTKDELKNRISMALKDPILQQGFEIICKENAQLTKAKELLEKLLEEEKNNMYWKMDGSDKSSYYEVKNKRSNF